MTRVADLAGAELALWVARVCAKHSAAPAYYDQFHIAYGVCYQSHQQRSIWAPHKDWGQGGPLIEKHQLVVWPYRLLDQQDRAAGVEQDFAAKRVGWFDPEATGPTYLVAAMRAIVVSEFGDEVDDPS